MYPGLSDADCQVATFRYHQLVGEGQRQQFVEDARLTAGITRLDSASIRRQIGELLVCAGQRLQGVHAVTSESRGLTSTGEMGALA